MYETIEALIKSKTDKKQKIILSHFLETFQTNSSHITVSEFDNHYEIIVYHQSNSPNYTGGAEQYLLDKQTGKWTMGWHEHPMQIQPIQIEPHEKNDADLSPETGVA